MSVTLYAHCFNTALLQPVLEYGSEIWGLREFLIMERTVLKINIVSKCWGCLSQQQTMQCMERLDDSHSGLEHSIVS